VQVAAALAGGIALDRGGYEEAIGAVGVDGKGAKGGCIQEVGVGSCVISEGEYSGGKRRLCVWVLGGEAVRETVFLRQKASPWA
jgi:hypothetical protein